MGGSMPQSSPKEESRDIPSESYAAQRQLLLAAAFPTAAFVVAGLTLLYVISALIRNPSTFPAALPSYLIQVAIPLIGLALAKGPLRRHVEPLALGTDMAFSAILAARLFIPHVTNSGTALVFSLKMVATAVLFPWATRFQYASVVATLVLYWTATAFSGRSLDATHQLVGPVIAAIVAAFGAAQRDSTRRKVFLHGLRLSQSEEQLRSALESERSLVSIAREISRLTDLPSLLERINKHTAAVLGCSFSSTYLVDYERREIAAASTDTASAERRAQIFARRDSIDTPLAQVLLQGQTIVIDDPARQTWLDPDELAKHSVDSLALAPIVGKGQVLGVITAGRQQSAERFDERQIALLDGIAAHAAVAIENARLFDSLAASEARYRDLFEHANDLIFVVDENGAFRFANQAALAFVGATSQAVSRLTYQQFLAPGSNARLQRRISIALRRRNHDSGRPFEVEVCRPGGVRATLELRTRLVSRPGQSHTYQCVGRDVTERRRHQVHTQQLLRELKQLNRLQTEFVANVSHELRTPLNVIIGYSDLLADDPSFQTGSDVRSFVGRISSAARALHRLVESVLEYARLDRGRTPLLLTRFSADQLMLELRALCNDVCASPDVNVHVSSIPDFHFCTDYDRLYSVLSNLLLNALKFTPRGDVSLSLVREGGEAEFCVRDTGIGIEPDNLLHVFEPFQQVDGSPTRSFGGVGLGLAIVRRNVDLLGGSVTVDSQVDVGTTFRIRIPIELGADAPRGKERPAPLDEGPITRHATRPQRPELPERPSTHQD